MPATSSQNTNVSQNGQDHYSTAMEIEGAIYESPDACSGLGVPMRREELLLLMEREKHKNGNGNGAKAASPTHDRAE